MSSQDNELDKQAARLAEKDDTNTMIGLNKEDFKNWIFPSEETKSNSVCKGIALDQGFQVLCSRGYKKNIKNEYIGIFNTSEFECLCCNIFITKCSTMSLK